MGLIPLAVPEDKVRLGAAWGARARAVESPVHGPDLPPTLAQLHGTAQRRPITHRPAHMRFPRSVGWPRGAARPHKPFVPHSSRRTPSDTMKCCLNMFGTRKETGVLLTILDDQDGPAAVPAPEPAGAAARGAPGETTTTELGRARAEARLRWCMPISPGTSSAALVPSHLSAPSWPTTRWCR